jgi:hypothetical protein
MEKERKKVKGVCAGLVVGSNGASIHGGVYPALARGECTIISFESRQVAEILEFASVATNVVIEVDKKWEEKFIKK